MTQLKPLFGSFFTSFIMLSTGFASSVAFANQANPSYKICAIYPHLKDSYWISVNYGMVQEAKKQNIELRVLEAGGYPNARKQSQQLQLCTKWAADAILLGTVDPYHYQHSLSELVGSTPVFATVNHLALDAQQSPLLKGQVGVDWYWMGYEAGVYLAERHPKGSGTVNVVTLLGPKTSGGTKPVARGFKDAIKQSDVKVIERLYADNDKELQRNLVQQTLEMPDVDYIVGSAVAIEAAISELRSAERQDIGLISTYLSHGVYRGLLRHRVQFAPTDKMVEQGELSVKQAVSYLNKDLYSPEISPEISALTPNSLSITTIDASLSPSEYRPIFNVK